VSARAPKPNAPNTPAWTAPLATLTPSRTVGAWTRPLAPLRQEVSPAPQRRKPRLPSIETAALLWGGTVGRA